MSEWKEKELGQFTTKIGSGATPRGGSNSYKDEGISLIRSQNILDLKFSTNGLAFIDEDQAEALKNVNVESDDVLLNITGDSVARACKVPEAVLPARVNQHVSIIRANREQLIPDYLLYNLIHQKEELLCQSEIGATRRAITKGMIEQFKIKLPPLPEQKSIASVLSSLDDKIDLLHRQNKTLEAMAETMFRQWFVEAAEEDWEEDGILEIIQLVGGGTPKTSISDYWDGNIPWLAGGDIASNHKSFIIGTEKNITENGLSNSSAKLLHKYATVISARGTVGKYCLLGQPMAFSQSNYGILPKIENTYFFAYLLVNHIVEELKASAYGSVFDTITTATFKEIKIAVPSKSEIINFENTVSTYFRKMIMNRHQIHTLEKLRDILLPKLMSGEVRVTV